MIIIRNNLGQVAEMGDKSSIKIERYNPLFTDDDKLFQEITYSFKLPASPSNNIFFNYGYLLETSAINHEMEVTVDAGGVSIFAAILKYKFIAGEYDAILKVNLGSIAEKISKIKLGDVITLDAKPESYNAAYMKTVAENPSNYPYAFFPIYNGKWHEEDANFLNKEINMWVHSSQSFRTMYDWRTSGFLFDIESLFTPAIPFFKVSYILKKILEFLGFQARGNYFVETENDQVYLYGRKTYGANIFGSTSYLPGNLTIAAFLKILKTRFKIVCFFDLLNKSVNVETANSILNSNDFVDISRYVSAVDEFSPYETRGFTVKLKPDSEDEQFKNGNESVPTSELIIGDGSKQIEIEASTLKKTSNSDRNYLITTQPVFYKPTLMVEAAENWMLRFMKFSGMKSVSGGVFPESLPLELNEADGRWYQFLVDSKETTIQTLLPSSILRELDGSKKIIFKSTEGTTIHAVISKSNFELSNDNDGFFEVEIECNTIMPAIAPIKIKETKSVESDDNMLEMQIMAYFPEQVGISKVDYEVVYENVTSLIVVVPSTIISPGTLEISTDSTGVLGQVTKLGKIFLHPSSTGIIKIYGKMPSYAVINGKKYTFVSEGSHWKTSNFITSDRFFDGKPIWIVYEG